MVLVTDDGWVPGSFFGGYHLKGLRAELRNGESETQVCSLWVQVRGKRPRGGGALRIQASSSGTHTLPDIKGISPRGGGAGLGSLASWLSLCR